MNLSHHLQRMMSDWFIIKGKVNIEDDADEAELALAYKDLEDYSMNQNSSPVFFKYARFYIKENDDIVQCRLHVGDIVSINTEEFRGSFTVIMYKRYFIIERTISILLSLSLIGLK
ncbi:unnamed protein product [Rhizophagus irregularis]|nr:unnamed protein product [Rhizophagus irregularis]